MLTVKLKLDKETKGAVRYAEEGPPEGQVLRTMYIRKSAFEGEYPKQITVKVEY